MLQKTILRYLKNEVEVPHYILTQGNEKARTKSPHRPVFIAVALLTVARIGT